MSGPDDPDPTYPGAGNPGVVETWSVQADSLENGEQLVLHWKYRNDAPIEAGFDPATSLYVGGKELTPIPMATRKASKAVGPDPFLQPAVVPGAWQEQAYVYKLPAGHSGEAFFVVWTTGTERAPQTGKTYEVVRARTVLELGAVGG